MALIRLLTFVVRAIIATDGDLGLEAMGLVQVLKQVVKKLK